MALPFKIDAPYLTTSMRDREKDKLKTQMHCYMQTLHETLQFNTPAAPPAVLHTYKRGMR